MMKLRVVVLGVLLCALSTQIFGNPALWIIKQVAGIVAGEAASGIGNSIHRDARRNPRPQNGNQGNNRPAKEKEIEVERDNNGNDANND